MGSDRVHDVFQERYAPCRLRPAGSAPRYRARARAGSAWRKGGGDGRAPPHAPPAFVYAVCTRRSLSERHHPLSDGARRGPDGSSLSLRPSTGVVAHPCRGLREGPCPRGHRRPEPKPCHPPHTPGGRSKGTTAPASSPVVWSPERCVSHALSDLGEARCPCANAHRAIECASWLGLRVSARRALSTNPVAGRVS